MHQQLTDCKLMETEPSLLSSLKLMGEKGRIFLVFSTYSCDKGRGPELTFVQETLGEVQWTQWGLKLIILNYCVPYMLRYMAKAHAHFYIYM